jgi:hypothetical protein
VPASFGLPEAACSYLTPIAQRSYRLGVGESHVGSTKLVVRSHV